MKFPLLLFAFIALALGGLLSTRGHGAPRQPVAVQAVVTDVSDTRTTAEIGGRCVVGLSFTGDAAGDALDIMRLNLKTALDDLNRDLILNVSQPNNDFLSPLRKGLVRTAVTLRNPSRNATVIKVLEGEVEFFTPTVGNSGLVNIKDFFKLPTAPMRHPFLIKNDIQVLYVTKAVYEARKAELQAQYKYVRGQWPYQHAACLFFTDPNLVVASFEVHQADGTRLGGGMSWINAEHVGNQGRMLALQSAPAAGCLLKVTLKSPESIRTFPFKLEKIQLP